MQAYLAPFEHWMIQDRTDAPRRLVEKIEKRERELNGVKLPLTKAEARYCFLVLGHWGFIVKQGQSRSRRA